MATSVLYDRHLLAIAKVPDWVTVESQRQLRIALEVQVLGNPGDDTAPSQGELLSKNLARCFPTIGKGHQSFPGSFLDSAARSYDIRDIGWKYKDLQRR